MDKKVPDKIFDVTVRDQAYMDKYSLDLNKKIQSLLKSAQDEVVASLAKNDPTSPTMTKWKQQRLETLNKDISSILDKTYKDIKGTANNGLMKAGNLQAKSTPAGINQAIGVDVFKATVDPSQVKAIVGNTLIDGKTIGEWWDKQSADTKTKLSSTIAAGTQALQVGMVQGESIGQLIGRVRGSALTPGVMSVTKREAEALVRTSVMQVSGAVRQELYKDNADVLDGFEVVATLDNRTTPQCQMMDGKRYDMNMNPVGHGIPYPGGPPFHWNCRSTIVPIPKSFKDLAGPNSPLSEKQIDKLEKKFPVGERASVNGPIKANITYQEWLLDQPIPVQKDILGEARYRLWSENKLDVGDLVTDTGHSLTIRELEDRFKTLYMEAPAEANWDAVAPSNFIDRDLRKIDEAINKPEILAKINIPKELDHVTPTKKKATLIKNEGFKVGSQKSSEVGESTNRIYFSNDKYGILDNPDVADLYIDAEVLSIRTKGLSFRLDPEYYGDFVDDPERLIKFANSKPGPDGGLYVYVTKDVSNKALTIFEEAVEEAISVPKVKPTWLPAKTVKEAEEQINARFNVWEVSSKGGPSPRMELRSINSIGNELSEIKNMERFVSKQFSPMDRIEMVDDYFLLLPDGSRSGGYYQWAYGKRPFIVLSTRHSISPTMQIGNYAMNGDLGSIIRHEFGHHVWRTNLEMNEKSDFIKFFRSKESGWVKKKITEYGASNFEECFAEAFSIYTSFLYGSTAKTTLVKEIDDLMLKMFGKAPALLAREVQAITQLPKAVEVAETATSIAKEITKVKTASKGLSSTEVMKGLLIKSASKDEILEVFTARFRAKDPNVSMDFIKKRIDIYEKIAKKEIGSGTLFAPVSEKEMARALKKVERAKASHVPATREVQIIARENQELAALKSGGIETPDNHPFDIIRGKDYIELKTIVKAKNDKITMHPESLLRKNEFVKDIKGARTHTLIVDERTGKVYYSPGLGSFRLSSMEEIGTKNNFGPNLLKRLKSQPIEKVASKAGTFADNVVVAESKYSKYLASEVKRMSFDYPNAIYHDTIEKRPVMIKVKDNLKSGRFGERVFVGNEKTELRIAVDCFIEGGSPALGKDIMRHEFGHYVFDNLSDSLESKVLGFYKKYGESVKFPKDMKANAMEFFSESFSRVTATGAEAGLNVPVEVSEFIKKNILREV